MRIRLLLTFAVLFTAITTTYAQILEGNLNFHGFADNREYAKSNRYSETIFGMRVAPEVGLLIDSTHRIRIGFNALHEFGSSKFTTDIAPVAYYQYMKKNWDFYLGAFSREGLISDFPRAILNDTLNYYRPNIEGMVLKYENANWKQIIFIDWTGKQTATNREKFIFGFSGMYKKNLFFVSHHAMMLHYALPAISNPDIHIEDNGAATLKVGLDLSKKTFLDSLTLSAGGLMSLERRRTVGGWKAPKGILLEMSLEYHKFGIVNSYYKGEGHHLIMGDKFYTAKTYNRTDLTWRPIVYKNLEAKLALSFHFVDGVIDSQQAFGLRYNLAGSKTLKRK